MRHCVATVTVFAAMAAAGCAQKGSFSFAIDAPTMPELSPLADPRRDSIIIIDEATGNALGRAASATAPDRMESIGDLQVGSYDVLRMNVQGGGQLLGLARARSVNIQGLKNDSVTLDLRKPIAYFGSSGAFVSAMPVFPVPLPVAALDTTLPFGNSTREMTVKLTDPKDKAEATASLRNGRLVVVGTGKKIYLVRTLDHSVAREILLDGVAKVRSIAVSHDDRTLAVVSSTGVSIVTDVPGLETGSEPLTLPVQKITDAHVATFSLDDKRLTVLAGGPPTWEAVDCTKTQPAASLWMGPVEEPLVGPTAIAAGATDIEYDDAGRLLIASPCDKGVRDMETGTLVVDGLGIYDIMVGSGKLVGIQGKLVPITLPVDPDDPRLRNVAIPHGQVAIGGKVPVPFRIASHRLDLELTDIGGSKLQIPIPAVQLDAYDAAMSPDGNSVVFANRVRYNAKNLTYFQIVDSTNTPYYYCILNVTEDVYNVSEVNLTSGAVSWESTKAINDPECVSRCHLCSVIQMPPCPLSEEKMCRFSDGYLPAGVSVLMGAP